ncbi:MAG: rRNA maturation RNase YbeY [Pseudomonadota bacterium]
MDIDVVIEAPGWQDLESWAQAACPAALRAAGVLPDGVAVVILGGSDARISALNAEFRGKPVPTNVLSWPSREMPRPAPGNPPKLVRGDLGDLALAIETCKREAADAGKPLAHHVCHLLVHGTLHLLGFDHETDTDAAQMETIETAALATLGVPDPY